MRGLACSLLRRGSHRGVVGGGASTSVNPGVGQAAPSTSAHADARQPAAGGLRYVASAQLGETLHISTSRLISSILIDRPASGCSPVRERVSQWHLTASQSHVVTVTVMVTVDHSHSHSHGSQSGHAVEMQVQVRLAARCCAAGVVLVAALAAWAMAMAAALSAAAAATEARSVAESEAAAAAEVAAAKVSTSDITPRSHRDHAEITLRSI